MNCKFLHIPYRCKIGQPACGSSFVKIVWKLLSVKMSLYHIKDYREVLSAEIV